MKNIQLFILLMLLGFQSLLAFNVSGTVSDSKTNQPVGNAEMLFSTTDSLTASATSARTDLNGNYNVELNAGEYFVTISSEFYRPQIFGPIAVKENVVNMNFSLVQGNLNLPFKLIGKVTSSAGGLPIAKAKIKLTALGFEHIQKSYTENDGSYNFSRLQNLTYILSITADGFTKLDTIVSFNDSSISYTNNTILLDLKLNPSTGEKVGYIAGKAIFSDGTPIKNAEIQYYKLEEESYFNFVTTDENGNYNIKTQPGYFYVRIFYFNTLTFRYNTYFYENGESFLDAKLLKVNDGQTLGNINFQLNSPNGNDVNISGTVKDENNNPLPYASVQIWKEMANGFKPVLTLTTDQNGKYDFNFVLTSESNKFKLSGHYENYYSEFYRETASFSESLIFTVISDTNISDIDFTLAPLNNTNPFSISGKVSNNLGLPITNALITAISNDGDSVSTFADSSGFYTLAGLKEGAYYVRFSAANFIPEYYDNAFVWEDATVIKVASNVKNIDAELSPLQVMNMIGKIHGYTKNAEGKILQGVTVLVKNSQNEALTYVISDQNGYYAINGLGDGEFKIDASLLYFNTQSQPVNVNLSSSALVNIDFTLSVTQPTDAENESIVPGEFSLEQNYPNPFNPSTKINYTLSSNSNVKLTVYNLIGEVVKELVNSNLSAGTYTIDFRAEYLPSGIYFYRLEAGNMVQTKKMMLLK